MKMAKTCHLCFLLDTPTPRHRTPPRWRSLCLGEPEAEFFEFFDPPRLRNPRLGEPLRLGQAIVPVLLFLRLILEFITLLFGFPMEDI